MSKDPASTPATAGSGTGACLVTDPITQVQTTMLLTQAECTARGGQFLGGPVGPALSEIAKPAKALAKAPAKAAKKSAPKEKTSRKK